MILVELKALALHQCYDFMLDERKKSRKIMEEIVEFICQKEQCVLAGDIEEMTLWDEKTRRQLQPELSLFRNGVRSGDSLLLI